MKNIMFAGFLFLLASIGGKAHAQTLQNEKNSYVVTTTNIKQLQPILLAAKELAAEDAEQFGEFKVLVCGKAVEDLTSRQTMGPYLKMASEVGARIIACEYSMDQLGMETSCLIEGVESVENAILENLQLQTKGYISLGL